MEPATFGLAAWCLSYLVPLHEILIVRKRRAEAELSALVGRGGTAGPPLPFRQPEDANEVLWSCRFFVFLRYTPSVDGRKLHKFRVR
jgi:hypothetical protein